MRPASCPGMTDGAARAWPTIARFAPAERRLSARAVRAGPVAVGFSLRPPHQRGGWSMVAPAKCGAWFLPMRLSHALVFALKAGNGLVRAPPARAKISSRGVAASATLV